MKCYIILENKDGQASLKDAVIIHLDIPRKAQQIVNAIKRT